MLLARPSINTYVCPEYQNCLTCTPFEGFYVVTELFRLILQYFACETCRKKVLDVKLQITQHTCMKYS